MIHFLRLRPICFAFSLVLLASFVGMFLYKQQTQGQAFAYSIDFTGGTEVLLKFENLDQELSTVAIKDTLAAKGWQRAIVRKFSDDEVLVRVQEFSNDPVGLGKRIQEAVAESMPSSNVVIQSTEAVGPGVGATLRNKSIRAVLFALIAMLLYIAVTFWSFAFAVGAVVALFHDALIMLATFLFFDREISINVIGAILAVMGYSINDTIVIFSRIRQNLKTMTNASLAEIVNTSLNQTLRRTLLTSFSTLLTVGSMFIFGGEGLRDFSLALLVGIIFGTYSSIYIASPVMMLLYRKKA